MLNVLLHRGSNSGNERHQQLCIQRVMCGRFTGERCKLLGGLLQLVTSRPRLGSTAPYLQNRSVIHGESQDDRRRRVLRNPPEGNIGRRSRGEFIRPGAHVNEAVLSVNMETPEKSVSGAATDSLSNRSHCNALQTNVICGVDVEQYKN